MWPRRTLQIVLGGYVAYFLFLLLTHHCLPLTINDTVGLPFHVPVIHAHQLGLNVSTALLMLMVLVCAHQYDRLRRVFTIGRKSERIVGFDSPAALLPRATPGAVLVIVMATIGAPAYLVMQNRSHNVPAKMMDDLEQELHERIQRVAQPPPQIQIRPSPDRPWDSLPYTRLPVMDLKLPEISQFELDKAVPRWKDGFNSEHAVSIYAQGTEQWSYVPAFFAYAGTTYPVDVRYRGWNFDHYLGFKKSWRVRFRKNDPFFGRREFNLINQRDHSVVSDLLWSEVLRDSGIMTPYQFAVHARLNGSYRGVQTFLDQPDRFFCERHNRNASMLVGEARPFIRDGDQLKPEFWQQYSHWSTEGRMTGLHRLYELLSHRSSPAFPDQIEELLDVRHYLTYCAHALFACHEEPSTHNVRWILDPGVGRFQMIPWYQGASTFRGEGYHDLWRQHGWSFYPPLTAINDFADSLLRHPAYRQQYLAILWDLLRSSHHREELQTRLDSLYGHVRADVHADTHIHVGYRMERYLGNGEWEEIIPRMRQMIDSRWTNLCALVAGKPVQVQPSGANTWTITSENYADLSLESLVFDKPVTGKASLEIDGKYHLFDLGRRSDLPLPAKFARKDFLMGPGILMADAPPPKVNERRNFHDGLPSRYGSVFQPQPVTATLRLDGDRTVQLKRVVIRNQITRRTLSSPPRYPDYSSAAHSRIRELAPPTVRTPESTLESVFPDGVSLGAAMQEDQVETIRLPVGSHRFETNFVVNSRQRLLLRPGTILRFAPNVSLIVRGEIQAHGTPEQPIRFEADESGRTWGSLFLNNLRRQTNQLTHCVFANSANTIINEMPVTAALAAYSAPVVIRHCRFENISADDAFNSKYVSPTISDCTFSNNLDAIDIDMGGGHVSNCDFIHNRDDCIDLSSAWAVIEGNRIQSHGDKGISVGEKSRPTIFNNHISKAAMGIAVKDLSHALILNNTCEQNEIAVALYEKKITFGPATAVLVNNNLFHNRVAVDARNGSAVTARFNSSSPGLSGEGNLATDDRGLLSVSGSGRPASFYGLADANMTLNRIGSF